jgi:hypothetical protein
MFGEARDLEMEAERLGLGSSDSAVRVPIYGMVARHESSSSDGWSSDYVSFEESPSSQAHSENLKATYWMVDIEIQAAGHGHTFSKTDTAMLDSGTSLIMAPEEHYMALLNALLDGSPRDTCSDNMPGAEGTIVCPCDAITGHMTLTFEDRRTEKKANFILDSKDLKAYLGQGIAEDGASEVQVVDFCRLTVQPMPMSHWILGDAFFRRAFIVHDINGHQVTIHPRQQPKAMPIDLVDAVPGGFCVAWISAMLGAACGMLASVLFIVRCRRCGDSDEDHDGSYFRIDP